MTEIPQWMWSKIARVAASPEVADFLIQTSFATPYYDIGDYMARWWLFNPYGKNAAGDRVEPPYPNLSSGRIHHIKRRDKDRHHHDHPWDARTIVLRGWYREIRLVDGKEVEFIRKEGQTATLNYGEYHTITEVSPGGVWTLFITHEFKGEWGFFVDGVKVPWKEYEKQHPELVFRAESQ